MPELYVIYTGDRKTKPSEISLSQRIFRWKGMLFRCKGKNDI